jgi:hypothetical protein
VEFVLKRPYHPESGEGYFWLALPAYKQVSKVRIHFLERRGRRYRVELSALVHRVFPRPTQLRYASCGMKDG